MSSKPYQFGQLLRLTDKAQRMGLQGHAKTEYGVFLKQHGNRIAVRRVGLKAYDWYHKSYWRDATSHIRHQLREAQ